MSSDIFISYRRSDGNTLAHEISRELTARGYDVYIDEHNLRSGDYRLRLKDAVEKCTDFIAVCTKDYLSERILDDKDLVKQEIVWAANKNIIPVYPTTSNRTDIAFDLPEELSKFNNYDPCYLFNPLEIAYDFLCREYINSQPIDPVLRQKVENFDIYTGDPHGLSTSKKTISTAINIVLKIENCDNTVVDCNFYDYYECFEKVVRDNLIITNIRTYSSQIVVFARHSTELINLRKLSSKDIPKVKLLIKENNNEFKEKSLWRGRNLYDMAENGLKTRKWTAYGYFDSDNNLVSYADYKIRSDGAVELGIVLTKKEFRKKGYASSLIWMFKLRYASSDFVSGTYEGNDEMTGVFGSTGYQADYSVNRDTFNQMTNKIAERKNPETGEFTDNSIYYHSNKLFPLK